jgi:signal transduction histidine kinase
MGIFLAFFTGHIFSAVLDGHNWGSLGKPGWAAHSGALGLTVALGLALLALGSGLWTTWWVARVSALTRDRYQAWYVWSAILGIPVGLALGRSMVWLIHTQRVPASGLNAVLLGTVATVMTSCMIGYYRLQGLARTQRDLLLQAQLAPHFLFNSLSTLKGQIAEEPMEAHATADRLARLFRELMDLSDQTTIPLTRELAFVEAYLGLEKARLGERLQVHIQVPEELEDLPVPPLSLQVLVENAVRHAIASRVEGGLLSIRARCVPEGLQLVVGDPGTGESPMPGTGRGLQVLRARLARPSDLAFEKLPQGHQATLLLRKG